METAIAIIEQLHAAGYDAYIVGGAVRDMVRNKIPKDYDVATNARAPQIMEVFPDAKMFGEAYEIILVDGIEVAPFRVDEHCDGRQATVRFVSSIEEDLARRDFTCNAMAYDVVTEKIIDPYGGRKDTMDGYIRFVGNANARLREDWFRGVRAARFNANFGWNFLSETHDSIKRHAATIVERVSPERWMLEIKKLRGSKFSSFFHYLYYLGILAELLPEVKILDTIEQDKTWHPEGNAWKHTELSMKNLTDDDDLATCLAVLLHDIGKAIDTKIHPETHRITAHGHDKTGSKMIREVLRRLDADNKLIDEVEWLVQHHMKPNRDPSKKTLRRLRREKGDKMLDKLFRVGMCDARGSCGLTSQGAKTIALWKIIKNEPEEVQQNATSVLDGEAIMELLYICPGKEVGEAKLALLDYQLSVDHPVTELEGQAFLRLRREQQLSKFNAS